MANPQERTHVRVDELTAHLCGPLRPGHFEGVATVVAKLFALVGPCDAAFGRKDYQQFKVIERMTQDLFFPVRLHGVATVREPDFLAMSSRNAYLSPADRQRARAVPQALLAAASAHTSGLRDADALRTILRDGLGAMDRIEYAEVADPELLRPLLGTVPSRCLFSVAVRAGQTRLIDNRVTSEDAWG
jgi:pantoate--beta-alanine ligase